MIRARRRSADSFSSGAGRRRRVTLILLLVGLGSGAAALYAQHQVKSQSQHRVADGTITGTSAYKSSGVWHLNVEFSFEVQGHRYVGHESRLLREDFENEKEALGYDKSAVPNAAVKVHYPPDRPQAAYLQPRARGLGFFAKAAVLWLSVALFWFVYDRTQASRQEP